MKNKDKEKENETESKLPEEAVEESEGIDSEAPVSESEAAEEAAEASEESAEESVETLLRRENDEIIAELADLKDKYQRLAAEYDNYRKRTQREKAEIYPDAMCEAIKEFLPAADNFDRAANAETSDENYKAGVIMIKNQLDSAFSKLGVEAIDRVGEQFDPNLEEAVMQVTDEELGESVVKQVFQKGYKRGDKVIRHAMVAVANS